MPSAFAYTRTFFTIRNCHTVVWNWNPLQKFKPEILVLSETKISLDFVNLWLGCKHFRASQAVLKHTKTITSPTISNQLLAIFNVYMVDMVGVGVIFHNIIETYLKSVENKMNNLVALDVHMHTIKQYLSHGMDWWLIIHPSPDCIITASSNYYVCYYDTFRKTCQTCSACSTRRLF